LACKSAKDSIAWSYDFWHEMPQSEKDKWLKLSFSNKHI